MNLHSWREQMTLAISEAMCNAVYFLQCHIVYIISHTHHAYYMYMYKV